MDDPNLLAAETEDWTEDWTTGELRAVIEALNIVLYTRIIKSKE